MRFTTIGSEKSVDELAARLYGKISKAKSAVAAATLSNANPQLGTAPKKGAVIVVPDSPELPPANQAEVADPAGQLERNIAAAVAAFREHLAAAAKANANEAAAEAKLLKSAGMKRLINEMPEVQEHATRVAKAIKLRQAAAKEMQTIAAKRLMSIGKG